MIAWCSILPLCLCNIDFEGRHLSQIRNMGISKHCICMPAMPALPKSQKPQSHEAKQKTKIITLPKGWGRCGQFVGSCIFGSVFCCFGSVFFYVSTCRGAFVHRKQEILKSRSRHCDRVGHTHWGSVRSMHCGWCLQRKCSNLRTPLMVCFEKNMKKWLHNYQSFADETYKDCDLS